MYLSPSQTTLEFVVQGAPQKLETAIFEEQVRLKSIGALTFQTHPPHQIYLRIAKFSTPGRLVYAVLDPEGNPFKVIEGVVDLDPANFRRTEGIPEFNWPQYLMLMRLNERSENEKKRLYGKLFRYHSEAAPDELMSALPSSLFLPTVCYSGSLDGMSLRESFEKLKIASKIVCYDIEDRRLRRFADKQKKFL